MTKYIEVTNNNGTVSIDDTTARLVKTKTITFNDDAPFYVPSQDVYYLRGYISDKYIMGALATMYVDLSSNESLVAIRALNKRENVAVLGGFISPKRYMIVLMSSWENNNLYMNDFAIDVYGTVPNTEIGNVGMEIFDANGNKIFDSNYYAMDVVNTYSIINTKDIKTFTDEPDTYEIGGYSRSNYAIIMSSCINKVILHARRTQFSGPIGSIQYGAVFGDSIRLEKRINEYLSFVYSGGTWTPQSYSVNSSGIILNTQNIS